MPQHLMIQIRYDALWCNICVPNLFFNLFCLLDILFRIILFFLMIWYNAHQCEMSWYDDAIPILINVTCHVMWCDVMWQCITRSLSSTLIVQLFALTSYDFVSASFIKFFISSVVLHPHQEGGSNDMNVTWQDVTLVHPIENDVKMMWKCTWPHQTLLLTLGYIYRSHFGILIIHFCWCFSLFLCGSGRLRSWRWSFNLWCSCCCWESHGREMRGGRSSALWWWGGSSNVAGWWGGMVMGWIVDRKFV